MGRAAIQLNYQLWYKKVNHAQCSKQNRIELRRYTTELKEHTTVTNLLVINDQNRKEI